MDLLQQESSSQFLSSSQQTYSAHDLLVDENIIVRMNSSEERFLLSYSDIYNKTLQDPRVDVETVYTSLIGISITATTATLSALSSIVIIYVISKSSKGFFGSVYHRIMVGMSMADILQSITMAFTTLPMPTDMIYDQFQGLIHGTEITCRIQGSIYLYGYLSGNTYIIFLLYYYYCAIHLNMADFRFRKYFEPILHAFSILFSLAIAIMCWTFDFIKPSPMYSFCTVSLYPYWCKGPDDCLSDERSYSRTAKVLSLITTFTLGITGMFGIVCLIIIVRSMYVRERSFLQEQNIMANETAKGTDDRIARQVAWDDFIYTKRVMRQSLYYVLAYLSAYIFPIIRTVAYFAGAQYPKSTWYQICFVLMRPSQGVLNLLIFLYHKIWKLQRQFPNLSYFEAMKSILFHGEKEEDKAISSIESVRRHDAIGNLQLAAASEDDEELEESENQEEKFEDMPDLSISYHDGKVSSRYESKSGISYGSEPPSIGHFSRSSAGLSNIMGLSWVSKGDSVQRNSLPNSPVNKADDSSSISVGKSNASSTR
jgi:hypothetical protein